jgi:hypothetical protein
MKGTWRMATIQPRQVAVAIHALYNWRVVQYNDGTYDVQCQILPPFFIPVRVA